MPSVRVGGQRRFRRADVEAFIQPGLTPADLQVLWLHRAVAGKLVQAPGAVIAAATINVRRFRRLHPDGTDWEWLDRWAVVLEDGAESVLDALTSSADYAVELRRSSPFAGILTESERQRVLESFAESRRNRVRSVAAEQLERALHGV